MDIQSLASSKMFHLFAIANYRNKLRLIKIRSLNCSYGIKISGIRFSNFVHILVFMSSEVISVFVCGTTTVSWKKQTFEENLQ